MRAVGLDLGSVRIGVAVCDSGGNLAVPSATIERSRKWTEDHRRIADLVAEHGAEVVVVGMPLSMDGSSGPAARRAASEIEVLARALEVPVETYDERLSTVAANRSLRSAGLDAARSRHHVDEVAATVILQGWLDHRRAISQDPISQDPISQDPISQDPISQPPISQDPIVEVPDTPDR